jgi:hypothetical protein
MCNTLDEPHLCKDLKKRYERQAKAIEIVVKILETYYDEDYVARADDPPFTHTDVAAEIVKAIGSRHLGVDE